MFSSVVLSLLLQQETGTEIVRSQGTIGGKVTIAQASNSLIWVMGVTGSVLLPWCVFKLPKTTVEQTKPWHKSIWSAHVRTRWQEDGPVFFCTLHLLLVLFILTFLSFFSLLVVVPLHSWFLPLLTTCILVLSVQTLPSLYCEHCTGPGTMLAVSFCRWREKRPKQTCTQRLG